MIFQAAYDGVKSVRRDEAIKIYVDILSTKRYKEQQIKHTHVSPTVVFLTESVVEDCLDEYDGEIAAKRRCGEERKIVYI